MQADRGELSATATAAMESRSSNFWQTCSWILAATSELMVAARSPLTSDALACPSSALYRSAQLEPSRDSAATLPSGLSAHKRGRLAMEPIAMTVANKIVVPMRMINKLPVLTEHVSCLQKRQTLRASVIRSRSFGSKMKCSSLFILKGSIQEHPRMARDGVVRQDSREHDRCSGAHGPIGPARKEPSA
jgi:hypothetical protein